MFRTLFLTAAALAATGCSSFYTRTVVGSTTRTTFDSRLPDGLTEVFESCTEPLDLEPGMTEVDFVNGCTTADTAGASADTLLTLLTAAGPIALPSAIDDDVFRDTFTFDDFPWPMQNCEVDFTVDVNLARLRLLNMESEWRSHDGRPSMHIDFDFEGASHVVDVLLTANVQCPSAINDAALQATLNAILPNNRIEIDLTGMDLDLDVMLAVSGGRLAGTLDTNLNIGGVNVHNVIVDLANAVGITDAEMLSALGLTFNGLEADIEPMVDDALATLPTQVASYLQMAVPSGHTVSSVAIVTSGGVNTLRISSN